MVQNTTLPVTDFVPSTKILEIKGEFYMLTSKMPDRYGHLRFNLSKDGQEKPYSMSVSKTLYKDSIVPGYGCSCKGWIYRRSCKHVLALAQTLNQEV